MSKYFGSFKITASGCMFCLFASIPLYKFCGVSIVKRQGLVRRKKNADAHEAITDHNAKL